MAEKKQKVKKTPEQKAAEKAARKAEREKKGPDPLRAAIERVADATGLPKSYVSKKVAVHRDALREQHKAELSALATQVPKIVADAIAAAGAPAETAAPASE